MVRDHPHTLCASTTHPQACSATERPLCPFWPRGCRSGAERGPELVTSASACTHTASRCPRRQPPGPTGTDPPAPRFPGALLCRAVPASYPALESITFRQLVVLVEKGNGFDLTGSKNKKILTFEKQGTTEASLIVIKVVGQKWLETGRERVLASCSSEKLNSMEETCHGVVKWVKTPESVAVDSLSLQVIDCYKRQILHLETIILGIVHDRVNFVVCQLFALLAAIWFRTYLHSSKTSPFIRHVVATLLGLYLALFCFGWYALHFVIQSGISYYIMIIIGVENMHKYCFVFALGYLTVCQITRVYIFDYGQYSADFSGPMMIITQKITSLAFEIHDGMFRKNEDLTPSQRCLAVRRMPSLLEYLSYNCNFMGILAGPLCSYKDYITFIEGRSYQLQQSEANGKEDTKYEQTDPSPNIAVAQKLLICGLSLLFHMTITKTLPVEYNVDDHFRATASWPVRFFYLYVSLMAARPKYYFAWTLADAINNAAGFGFRGYDKNGVTRWDLISNLRIQQIEFSTSFKMFLDNWNIQTALWLKRVCYERATFSPTIQTFILSAIWHGVYPGYYLTFLTGVLMTLAARAIRNNIRHYFVESPAVKLCYDFITWMATQLAISYTVVPFVLLSVKPSFTFYSSCYFCLHIASILVLLVFPLKRTQKGSKKHESVQPLWSRKLEEENLLQKNSYSTTNNSFGQKQEITCRYQALKQ
ncbi:membrane bound O-acyltransferase domain containing 2 [Columba livia]|uniref:Membrane bound O-acyltransferase domain containing 2 n=1 Tax=Columba livia TaxID=8932 RepID=A0A2I0MUN2_COLLI|nr:membrane bound O-acyltransferase domain containing 2 [Columba livia]